MDDGAFAFPTRQDLENSAQQIYEHLAKFGLQMHIGSNDSKSKTEAIYIPSSLEKAQSMEGVPEEIWLNQENHNIHFERSFRYLGSIIAPDLTNDAKI